MNYQQIKKFISFLPILLLYSGCFPSSPKSSKVTVPNLLDGTQVGQSGGTNNSTTTGTSTPTPTTTSTPTPTPTVAVDDCANPGNGVGSSNFPYLKERNIIKHGFYQGGVPGDRFNSDIDLKQNNKSDLATDVRFRFRIKARPNPPGNFSISSPGCKRSDIYTMMQVNVGVRASNQAPGNYSETHVLTIPVGQCSPVVEVNNLPQLGPNDTLAVDIFDVRTDWQCVQDPYQSYYYCNQLYFVSFNSCWQLDLHIETDYTNSIPTSSPIL